MADIDWSTVGKVAGAVGAIGGAGVGLVNLFRNNKKASSASSEALAEQYRYNLSLQQQAQQWNEYMYRNRYQMQVQDLENAGINKLYGIGNAPTVTSGMSSVSMPDKVGEQNNKMARLLEAFNLAREYSSTKAQNEKTEIETLKEFYNAQVAKLDALRKAKENKYIDKREQVNINNAQANTTKVLAETDKIIADKMEVDRRNQWHKNNPMSSAVATGSTQFGNPINTGIAIGTMNFDNTMYNLDKQYEKAMSEFNKIYDSAKYNRKYFYRKYLY